MRGARGDRLIQRGAMAAEHRDGCSGLRQHGCNLAANAPPASGDERMQGMRQSGHAQPPPKEFINQSFAYILDFKLLQEISFQSMSRLDHLDRGCLTDGTPQVASDGQAEDE